jgi:hypothetical protein
MSRRESVETTAVEDGETRWAGIEAARGLEPRYELKQRIGSGAMGVVHAAYDPRLNRILAIKLLSPERETPRARQRLLREAQAMARLAHPNVISVHDVGEMDGRVFVAMDYVQGETLSRWLETHTREWREVVDLFVQAGRGLAAAHDAGMVHRDFKPQNVLVDEHMVARVMDFGLVRPSEESMFDGEIADLEEATDPSVELSGEPNQGTDPALLTKTGAVLGTPAYMAPEQATGKGVDARSDQFSFCVALFEGLYGHRPYEGGSAAELASSAQHEQLVSPKRRADVPPRIHAAMLRGLRRDPEKRWPSMDALLHELTRTRFHIPVRAIAVGTGVVLLAGITYANVDAARAWLNPVTITLESSAGELDGPMELHEAGERDRYVAGTVANKGRLELLVQIPSAGRYYLHGLVWEQSLGGDRGDADSFFVYLDGGDEKLWHFGCQNQLFPERVLVDHWSWQPVLHMANADSDCEVSQELGWDLEGGEHLIVVRNREDAPSPETAARLARLVVTNQRDWRP